jgi:uncharacterized protein YcbX
MPRIARLSIAPVKSLGLLHPDSVTLTKHGVAEDRRFFLIDATGRLMDRLVIGSLVRIGAWTDAEATTLRLTFPDGVVADEPRGTWSRVRSVPPCRPTRAGPSA